MRRILIYSLLIITFSSCSVLPRFKKIGAVSENVTLMPYQDKTDLYGYINAETFEIVIPAQYEYTGPFVNGYAMVANKYEAFNDNIYFLINKNNETVLKYFNYAFIYESEDSKTVYALTVTNTGIEIEERKGVFSRIIIPDQ